MEFSSKNGLEKSNDALKMMRAGVSTPYLRLDFEYNMKVLEFYEVFIKLKIESP